MCGIVFHLRTNRPLDPLSTPHLDSLIKARGPDSFSTIQRSIPAGTKSSTRSDENVHLTFSASVLGLRGSAPVSQPLLDSVTGCVLMWNGEAWKFRGRIVTQNDTRLMFNALLAAVKDIPDAKRRSDAVREVLRDATGPFAFVFYDAAAQTVLYGRDPVGRRSLLRAKTDDGDVCISSVSDTTFLPVWEELPTGGIYELDVLQGHSGVGCIERFIPWAQSTENFFPRLNRSTGFPSDRSPPSPEVVTEFNAILLESMQLRTISTAPWLDTTETHDQFAVLFSGGVDCTLLAFMLDQVLPPEYTIDLLNVAFENPRVVAAAKQQANRSEQCRREATDYVYEECPDRKTGLSSYTELCALRPGRSWRFVRINVPYEETLAQRPLVTALMYPHNTEMDVSISLALFFASRGQGLTQDSGKYTTCTSKARILFSGLGADEIFGGYTRHAKAFAHSGLEGLINELDLDFNRIAERNLGRDDRIIAHWGREVRYPYLDESLTKWALSLPVWEKCGFISPVRSDPGSLEPSKLLLRTLANKVGLLNASKEKKRAIQFGARTAKMTIGRTKGTDAIVA